MPGWQKYSVYFNVIRENGNWIQVHLRWAASKEPCLLSKSHAEMSIGFAAPAPVPPVDFISSITFSAFLGRLAVISRIFRRFSKKAPHVVTQNCGLSIGTRPTCFQEAKPAMSPMAWMTWAEGGPSVQELLQLPCAVHKTGYMRNNFV